MNLLVFVVAVSFFGMGVAALIRPAFVWAPFGVEPETPAARNEVRAVYGGFGIAIAVILIAGESADATFRDGVLVTVAIALLGMAGGRVLAGLVEARSLRGFPVVFLMVESILAGMLFLAR